MGGGVDYNILWHVNFVRLTRLLGIRSIDLPSKEQAGKGASGHLKPSESRTERAPAELASMDLKSN